MGFTTYQAATLAFLIAFTVVAFIGVPFIVWRFRRKITNFVFLATNAHSWKSKRRPAKLKVVIFLLLLSIPYIVLILALLCLFFIIYFGSVTIENQLTSYGYRMEAGDPHPCPLNEVASQPPCVIAEGEAPDNLRLGELPGRAPANHAAHIDEGLTRIAEALEAGLAQDEATNSIAAEIASRRYWQSVTAPPMIYGLVTIVAIAGVFLLFRRQPGKETWLIKMATWTRYLTAVSLLLVAVASCLTAVVNPFNDIRLANQQIRAAREIANREEARAVRAWLRAGDTNTLRPILFRFELTGQTLASDRENLGSALHIPVIFRDSQPDTETYTRYLDATSQNLSIFASSVLDESSVDLVTSLRQALQQCASPENIVDVVIYGFSDSRAYNDGPDQSDTRNLQLSRRRASLIRTLLVDGVQPEEIGLSVTVHDWSSYNNMLASRIIDDMNADTEFDHVSFLNRSALVQINSMGRCTQSDPIVSE